jgi:hypothetical protein
MQVLERGLYAALNKAVQSRHQIEKWERERERMRKRRKKKRAVKMIYL